MKKDYLSKFLEFCTFATFSLLVINVLFQVLSRKFFPQFSVIWTEEMSRLLFVYSVAFAAPLAAKRKEYVSVELFQHRVSPKLVKVLKVIIELTTILLFTLVSYTGISFVKLGMNQRSVTMGHQMGYVYMSIVGTCILITIYSVNNLVMLLKEKKGME